MTWNAGTLSVGAPKAVTSVTQDEASAFDQWVRDHQDDLTRVVGRLLAWPSDQAHVDDVVQEVFLKAWMNRNRFHGDCQVLTWLTRIAINESRNYMRRRTLFQRFVDRVKPFVSEAEAPTEPMGPESEVRDAIRRLRSTDREMIVMRYLEERTPEEIAFLLKLKRNTVDARLVRARRRLAQLLGQSRGDKS